MRHARRLSLGSLGVVVLTLAMLLSGCGRTATALGGQAAPTNTPTPRPTTAPAIPTAPTSATASASAIPADPGCPQVAAPTQPQYVAVGALNVSVPAHPFGQGYPSALLPNGLPNAPYQVPLTPDEAEQAGAFHPNPAVNPAMTPVAGYGLQICNETSTAHTLTSLSVTIATFTPSSGPVAVWHVCADGPYDTATKQTTPGCGGGLGASDALAATLPTDRTGASATAKATNMGVDLPARIGPRESITLLVAINGLTSQGTYALSFGVSVDGSTPTSLTPSDGSFFIAPSAVMWTGTACQTPSMQAQIPASSQHTYYVCPPAA